MRLPGRSRHVCFNTFFSKGGEVRAALFVPSLSLPC